MVPLRWYCLRCRSSFESRAKHEGRCRRRFRAPAESAARHHVPRGSSSTALTTCPLRSRLRFARLGRSRCVARATDFENHRRPRRVRRGLHEAGAANDHHPQSRGFDGGGHGFGTISSEILRAQAFRGASRRPRASRKTTKTAVATTRPAPSANQGRGKGLREASKTGRLALPRTT